MKIDENENHVDFNSPAYDYVDEFAAYKVLGWLKRGNRREASEKHLFLDSQVLTGWAGQAFLTDVFWSCLFEGCSAMFFTDPVFGCSVVPITALSWQDCCTPLCGNSAQVKCPFGSAVKDEDVNKTSDGTDEAGVLLNSENQNMRMTGSIYHRS